MKLCIYDSFKGNELVIMRGLPGSGKSTLAKKMKGLILSADDYLMKDGVYVYNRSLIPKAHEWILRRAQEAMLNGVHRVIIDNTNINAWEFKPYAVYALANDYSIYLAEPDTKHKWDAYFLANINSHKVPYEIIQRMKEHYEPVNYLDEVLFSKQPF